MKYNSSVQKCDPPAEKGKRLNKWSKRSKQKNKMEKTKQKFSLVGPQGPPTPL